MGKGRSVTQNFSLICRNVGKVPAGDARRNFTANIDIINHNYK